jgi:tetratricopeptide (TPR) repeat protein
LPEAEQALRRALLLAPQRSNARASLARNLLRQGRSDEALAEARRESEEWARLWALAIIHHATGRPAESEAALRELIDKHGDAAAYQAAGVHAARGEADLAFECLERAYDASDPGLSSMMVEPLLVSLHGDARWSPFLRKMGSLMRAWAKAETRDRQASGKSFSGPRVGGIVRGRFHMLTAAGRCLGRQEARRAAHEIFRRERRSNPQPDFAAVAAQVFTGTERRKWPFADPATFLGLPFRPDVVGPTAQRCRSPTRSSLSRAPLSTWR